MVLLNDPHSEKLSVGVRSGGNRSRGRAGPCARLGMRDLNIDELQEIEEALNANLVATKPKLSLIFFNPCLTFY